MPEPDETLDAPVYEPPKRKRRVAIWLLAAILAVGAVAVGTRVALSLYRLTDDRPEMRTFLVDHLRPALAHFRQEHGRYPWPKPEQVTPATEISGATVHTELRALPGATINAQVDFLGEVRSNFLRNGALLDSWGHEILFRVDPKTGQAVIWSCGPNGIDETNDGASPDPAKLPKGYYWFGNGGTGDDITNPPELWD